MSKPNGLTADAIQAWMDGTANRRGVAVRSGHSSLRITDGQDLVALHAHVEQDLLFGFVRRYLRGIISGAWKGSKPE